MEHQDTIQNNNKKIFISTSILLILLAGVVFAGVQIYKTKNTTQDTLSGSRGPYERPMSCSDNRGRFCPGGVLATDLDEDAKKHTKLAIQVEEKEAIWEYYFHTYWCLSQEESMKPKVPLILGADDPYKQLHCGFPEKIEISKKIGSNYSSIPQAVVSEIINKYKWPKHAYKLCVSGNCNEKWRNIKACFELGACRLADVNTGGISTLIPFDIIGSIFDLFDPITKPPKLVEGSWSNVFPNVKRTIYSDTHY